MAVINNLKSSIFVVVVVFLKYVVVRKECVVFAYSIRGKTAVLYTNRRVLKPYIFQVC